MKKMIGVVGLIVLVAVSAVIAADFENLDVGVIKARQIRLYGNDPLYIGGTEANVTAAQLNTLASGNIDQARITNALATAGAKIGGNVPVAAITNAAGTVGASIGGNIPVAALTNAMATIQPAYGSGVFRVVNTTNLAFIAAGVTNVIDSDITTP